MRFYLSFLIACAFLLPTIAVAATSLPFTVNMSEAVTVDTTGGTPRIAINVGGITRYASYASGTGTSALTFTYAAVAGDVDLDGITLTSPVDLNGGTMKDLAGNNATLTFTLPTTTGVKIDYPSLSMDFTNGATGRYTLNGTAYNSLSSFLTAAGGTFSRASTATYFDSSGALQTAASGVPRFDYNPVTLAAKGILIEEARTNLLLVSEQIDNPSWSKDAGGGGVAPTITANYTTAPDGTMTADRVQMNKGAGVGYSRAEQYINASSSSTYVCSGWMKTNDGTIKTIGVRLYDFAQAKTVTPTWARFSVTRVGVTGSIACQFIVWDSIAGSSNTADLSIWGAQMEVGGFLSSYIPTTGATVTRAADALTIPAASWYNSSSGTTYLFANKPVAQAVSSRFYSFYPAGSGEISLQNHSATATQIVMAATDSSGVSVVGSSITGLTVGTSFKNAYAFNANDFASSTNGAAVVTDASGTFPALTGLRIGDGAAGGRNINSTIEAFKYYPARIPNTQLQLISQ